MRVFVPKPGEDWVCDVLIDDFCKHTCHVVVDDPRDADVVWLYAKWVWQRVPIDVLMQKPVVTTWHHIVPDKFNQHEADALDQFTDMWHVPNNHTLAALTSRVQKSITKLPYWVVLADWSRTSIMDWEVTGRLVASFQRDTEGNSPPDDPQPKLEKGPDLFAAVCNAFETEELQPFIPGWRRGYLKKHLKQRPITSKDKLSLDTVRENYGRLKAHDGVYLVTSRFEGGPQAVLECAATGNTVLSFDVGIASEVLHPLCICKDVDEMVQKLRSIMDGSFPVEDTRAFNLQQAAALDVCNVVPLYDRMLEEVVQRHAHLSQQKAR